MRRRASLSEFQQIAGPEVTVLEGGNYFQIEPSKNGAQIDLYYPRVLPVDGDGDIFIPGCSYRPLKSKHPLYAELGTKPGNTIQVDFGDFAKPNLSSASNGMRPSFHYSSIDDAKCVILEVYWQGEDDVAPAVAGIDSDFGRAHGAIYFNRHSYDDANRNHVDIWVLPIEQFDAKLRYDLRLVDKQAEAAGDVFESTRRAIAPLMFAYADDVLTPRLLDVDPAYCITRWYDHAHDGRDEQILLELETEQKQVYVVDTFPPTLDGVQNLAALIEEIALHHTAG